MATITFSKAEKYIVLGLGDIQVSVQELSDAIREYEAEITNLDIATMMSATGKDAIGGNLTTSITLKLLDGWKLYAQNRPSLITFTVYGGNFITDDETSPFQPATNVSYDRAQAVSTTLVQQQTIENIERHIEKETHGVGNTFYWNPISGNDLASGESEQLACKTFKHIHDNFCSSGNNDVVYCITPDIDGIVMITEKIDITKSNIHLRGEGNRHVIAPTEQGDAVRIIGTPSSPVFGVELSGFRIEVPTVGDNLTPPINSGNQANLHMHWAYNANIHDCHFMFGQGNGVQFHFCQNAVLENLDIHENPNTGMFVWNSKNSQVNNVRIFNNGTDGIRIQSDENWNGSPIPDWYVTNIIFKEVKIYDNVEYGIRFTDPAYPTLGSGDALGEIEELLLDFSTFVDVNGLGRTNNDTLEQESNHDNDIGYKISASQELIRGAKRRSLDV